MGGKEQFAKAISEFTNGAANPLGFVVNRAKREVASDMRSGRVPQSVGSFAELHDYVDANGYGGAFEMKHDPNEDGDWDYQDALSDFWNKVQDAVDSWLRGIAANRSPSYQAALLQDGTREEIISWLAWNDRNGCYTDADCKAEGIYPLTHPQAREILAEVLAPK